MCNSMAVNNNYISVDDVHIVQCEVGIRDKDL